MRVFLDLAEDDRIKQSLINSGKKRLDEINKISIAILLVYKIGVFKNHFFYFWMI